MSIVRPVFTALLAVAFGAALAAGGNAEPVQPGDAKPLAGHYHSLNYLVVTPGGPEDGGDFGPKTPGTKTSGLQEALDRAHEEVKDVYIAGGGVNGNKVFIVEINACRRGVYVTQGSGNNTIEAQWIHLTNLGIQLGDPQAPGVSGNRILAGISGDIPKTTGLQVFGHDNTLIVDVFSADPGRGLVFEAPAHGNLVVSSSLAGGVGNNAQRPTNRLITASPLGRDTQTPPMPASGTDVVNLHLFPVEVRILKPGKVSQWIETDPEGKAQVFEGPLTAGQAFTLNPGDRVRFTYQEAPIWHWKGLF